MADDSAALAPGYDDGGVDEVGQHRAGEALELEGEVVELLLCQVVLPPLAVCQPLAQVHLCTRSSHVTTTPATGVLNVTLLSWFNTKADLRGSTVWTLHTVLSAVLLG